MQTTYILRYNIHYSDNNTNGQESFDTLEQARRYMAKIKKEAP